MLLKCPECELQISDKASSCPHRGYPLSPNMPERKRKNKKSHLRLPNGFGQITELKNPNLRNPYRVMVTIGKTELGKPICKILKPQGYFKTYNEAYQALVEYNKSPYDISSNILMCDLYEKWSAEYFKTLKNESSMRTIKAAWNHCSELYNYQISYIRTRHLKACIDNADVSPNMKSRMWS